LTPTSRIGSPPEVIRVFPATRTARGAPATTGVVAAGTTVSPSLCESETGGETAVRLGAVAAGKAMLGEATTPVLPGAGTLTTSATAARPRSRRHRTDLEGLRRVTTAMLR
jgi:hypothetical protein